MNQQALDSIFNSLQSKLYTFVKTQREKKLRKNLMENWIEKAHNNQCQKLLRMVFVSGSYSYSIAFYETFFAFHEL